ncbi:hypothetical protein [uncultured Olegusella sp.]|uniref:hypothetical protein n=1 Tax=uncultured Olegusella sp. TaxID=1979846 RepID=UPI00261372BE|nr:hypothetical protein [uncultured Olegusella sp.]
MTPKITPKQLRKYADMYENNPSYDRARIMEDIGIKAKADGEEYLYPTSAILEAIADSIERHYVELPTDKDGKQIYINSTVYDKDGNIYHVQGLSSGKFNLMLSKSNEGKELAKLYRSSDFTITKPDSWECIIQDAFNTGMDFIAEDGEELMLKHGCSKDELVARCRKLAGEANE